MRWGDATVPDTAPCSEVLDPLIASEGYRLSVSAGSVEVRYSDQNGLRYARQTLGQLSTPTGIVAAVIEDHPDIAIRGHMLDISRDRVPTRDTLELVVERLATCRYNHLQLYTEHTFAYAGHEAVWARASPMTADDMHWLDSVCRSYGIELSANQNTFGHMERWLRHDEYLHRAEAPDGFDLLGQWRPPSALEPTPQNADFAVDLVRELVDCVSSRRVNIGCDEILELGSGRSGAMVKDRGRSAVFIEHLRRIAEPLIDDGLEVQFWADMVEDSPELAKTLADAGAIATIWDYNAPPDRGSTAFGPRLKAFAKSGFRTWVAPGTSGWNSFAGRHNNARENILDAVESAIKYDAEGVLVTEWGDNGHIQPPFATLPALAYGGITAWCRSTNGDISDEDLARSISVHMVDDTSEALANAWIELAQVADTLGLSQVNGAPYFYNWIRGHRQGGSPALAPDPDRLSAALAQADNGASRLAEADPGVRDGRQLVAETLFTAGLVRHGLRRLSQTNRPDSVPRDDLITEAETLLDQHRLHWTARSRIGGLDDSCSKMMLR